MNATQRKREEKNRAIERAILDSAIPLIKKEGYENLTIKEICENVGITTGIFYRHFKSKDDVISFAYLDLVDKVSEKIDDKIADLLLPDQLVALFTELIKCNQMLGRDSIFVFLNNANPECDCTVSRGKTYEIVERLVSKAQAKGFTLSPGRTAKDICEDLIVIAKGITYDWYSQGDSYDPVEKGHDLLERIIDSLL